VFDFLKSGNIRYGLKAIMRWQWTMSRDNRLQATINTVLGVLDVLADFAFIWATKLAIDIATPDSVFAHTAANSKFVIDLAHGKGHYTLLGVAFILIAIIVFQILLSIANRWVPALLGVKAQNRMQQKMFARLLQSEWSGLERHHSGDIINRLEEDVASVVSLLTNVIPNFATVCFQLVGAFVFLYFMDPTLALISVLISPFFIALSRVYFRKMRAITKDVRQTDSRVQSLLQETVQHRMIIKTLERNVTMVKRLEGIQSHLRQQVRNKTMITTFSSTLLNIGFSSVYLAAFLWAASRMQEGLITYGSMAAFLQLVGKVQGPLRSLTGFIPTFIGTFTASERLMELEEIPTEETGQPLRMGQHAGIRFHHVDFAYEEKDLGDDDHKTQSLATKIFSDFSFDFPPGSTTAILGETGVGKTTLIRLMLALTRPQEGRVTLYNDQQEVDASALTRCNFVYVPQGNTLFSGTIRDNLLLGDPDATEDAMRDALRESCAEFVLDLPAQLDTPCGELGGGLSEGQAQRIAIARALLRKGSILLLDEATSALDADTEQRLLLNLTEHNKDKTLIFITHRPAIVEHCTQTLKL
jgi:ATP-binding cassette subfamily B protein